MNHVLRVSLLLLAAWLLSAAVYAEPYLAIHTGSKCVACHISPTGGGMRTPFGSAIGQTALSARPPKGLWGGTITDRFTVGADARFNMTGTRIPNRDNRFEFNLEEVLLYAEFKLIPNTLSFYVDERVAPGGASNREAYALFWFNGNKAYVRAGRMFLPYGWRIEDDSSFIRQVPGINYATPDDGVEIGWETKQVSLNFAITNGTAGAGETDTGKQFSLRGAYLQPKWQAGISFNHNDVAMSQRTMGNVFAGLKTGKVNWLFEIDYIRDRGFTAAPRDQFIAFAEANIWLRQGHNLKFTYDYFDPDSDIDEDERNRYSAIWEYLPMQYLQLIFGVRLNDGIPQNNLQNTEEAFMQFHTYF